tara:strand:+ start:1270 stop:1845 length:576 start_codon:yes stop_codon:yes gene_type:complete
MNLKDYILQLDNWIPKNILEKTIMEFDKQQNWLRHKWTNVRTYGAESDVHGKKELDMLTSDNFTYNKELHQYIWKAIERYVVIDKIGGESFGGWKGFSHIRFNRYSEGQSMAKHNDHIHSIFDGQVKGIPFLSIVGVLNDDYQGGEFIMFDDHEIKFKAGDVLLFPSIFLYPHLVKPVTKGTRYSLVSWVF